MRALFVALLLVALGAPLAAGAQERLPLRITAYDTHSGITVTHFSFLEVQSPHQAERQEDAKAGSRVRGTTNACVSFVNTLPRDVASVDFHFVFYDGKRDHAGDADLIRTGAFAPNVPIDVNTASVNGFEDTKDCILVPRHDPRLALAVVFVKSATFADGSKWVTSGPAIAEHLDPN